MGDPTMVNDARVNPSSVGPVSLRLPPDPSLSRVLRLAASGIAAMAGFTIDQIDDIKIAVSEVLLALIEHGGGKEIEVEFAIETGAFMVRGHTAVTSFDAEHPDLALCRTVLASVCSSHGIELLGDRAHIWAAVAYAPVN
ncbi:MAG: ATP-binding protein [Ilumatobacteraceae bacterium]